MRRVRIVHRQRFIALFFVALERVRDGVVLDLDFVDFLFLHLIQERRIRLVLNALGREERHQDPVEDQDDEQDDHIVVVKRFF